MIITTFYIQRIFWQEQRKAMSTSNTGMRWHPVMIKWCLYLRHFSSKAYELLRSSGIIKLPSQRTLRDYTHFVSSKPGFSADLDKQLIKQSNSTNLEPHQRHVCLVADEMYVKEDLVYNKFTGELIGFANLGDINEHLIRLELEITNSTDEALAKTLFFFMVRGLFIHLNFPYAAFPCKCAKGDQLVPLFMEAIFRIELCGLHVDAITLDGNSVNRRFFQIMADKSDKALTYHKMKHLFCHGHNIYFFSDVPHLLKATRNCFANKKRNLCVSAIFIDYSN